ncbi:MAG TPA: serine/threonine-protein kinase [Dokdonella sp.]|uniref:serine/threonine-protein kinase n=1 Tax=Dokdonella sp. TaxID=2291710 RepID=UPI002D05B145|nr:serine/threonine-protein kinase [Dokdonella sp.]HUD41068.1 serine/threonine-protein kinase [Dokdonella sp.]
MDLTTEVEAMRVLEAALAQPDAGRLAWLEAQALPAAVAARVRVLLGRAAPHEGFLDPPAGRALPMAAGLPAPGECVGPWRLLRELDAGGMGVVFLAERTDGAYQRQVAVKFVRTDHLLFAGERRRELIARFENERVLLARVDHPNVARILDGGSLDGLPYLVMDYVEGDSLLVHCERRHLDTRARLALFCKVCDGVQAAHRHLIVHRDLKPGNVLVGADGEPRLLDFGIARMLDAGADAERATTRTGLLALTPAYASPEQLRLEPPTTASDVYSLGVILYELLTGTRPYQLEGLSPAEIERIVCDTAPVPLRQARAAAQAADAARAPRPAFGADLERIVARALHKAPERRYGSAQALADDLRRHLAGRPVQAHPDSLGYRIGKFVGRHRLACASGALAAIAVLAAGAVAIWQAAQAHRAAADTAAVNAFLVDVLKTSNPYMSGEEISLSEALTVAAGKVEERFGDRPDLAVGVRSALGESMLATGRLDAAELQLQRALADAEPLFGTDDPRTVTALATLASLRKDQGRYEEAQRLFDEALARLEHSGRTREAVYGNVLNDVGVMHLVREDFARAAAYLERAAAADAGGFVAVSADQRARTLANLAQAVGARGSGDLARADALYRQAQPVLEAAYPEGSPHLAVILNNRARLAWVRGDREAAIALQARAVAMHRRAFRGDHEMVLVPMTNLARQALALGRLDQAEEAAGEAAAMAERLYPDGRSHYRLNALAALAGTRLAQGRDTEAAALLLRLRTPPDALAQAPASTRDYAAELIAQLCGEGRSTAAPCAAAAR